MRVQRVLVFFSDIVLSVSSEIKLYLLKDFLRSSLFPEKGVGVFNFFLFSGRGGGRVTGAESAISSSDSVHKVNVFVVFGEIAVNCGGIRDMIRFVQLSWCRSGYFAKYDFRSCSRVRGGAQQ